MEQYALYLSDGTVITSGPGQDPAILKVTLTQTVNPETELSFGAVCSRMLEVSLWAAAPIAALQAAERAQLYRAGQPVGEFILEQPVRTTRGYQITAYDPVSLLDRDITGYLTALEHWPYTLLELVSGVCSACGLHFACEQIPNGEMPVEKFTARDITGRQLLAWAAQAAGCFCRAAADGGVEFAWYADTGVTVKPSGEAFYYAGTLQSADYQVCPATGVQIRWDEQDVGTVYPADGCGEDPYIIQANPLLAAVRGDGLQQTCQSLYTRLAGACYTPCQLTVPGRLGIEAGQIITVVTPREQLRVYVMHCRQSGGKTFLRCTGSLHRSGAAARNRLSVSALSGKVLRLQTDVDGIWAENADMKDNFTRVELDLQGLSAQVQSRSDSEAAMKQQLSQLELDSKSLQLQLKSVVDDGVSRVVTTSGYRFAEDGLTIQKSGQEMENRLDHTGMYVARSGEVILQASNRGVQASDVKVDNYLTVGTNARLEDYSDGTDLSRTACFYIGG